jgi:hypothetical protein
MFKWQLKGNCFEKLKSKVDFEVTQINEIDQFVLIGIKTTIIFFFK